MARKDEGFFSAKDHTRLFWQLALPDGEPTAWVGVVHGYGDHVGRYAHVFDALVKQGFAVMGLDYRGHGKADGKRGDVVKWFDYVDDLDVFWSKLRERAGALPCFVLAHSHGGLVATHWALRAPQGLKGLVLSSPFYKIAFDPPAWKLLLARVMKNLKPDLSIGNELKPEMISRDEAWQKATLADPLYGHLTTPRWWFEHTAAQAALAGRGKELTVPVFMLAGDADGVVSVPAAKAFFETLGSKDKTWKEFAGYRHEVMNEVGKEGVIEDIARWISAHR